MKAMIFAAGLGTRLKPWTERHPKALVEVGGKPMLQQVIERIREAGIRDIVINVHHFADQIEDFLKANSNFGADIAISDERAQLLDTGGAIAKAEALLKGSEPVIVYNADILSDFDIKEMIATHKTSEVDATLLTSRRKSSRQLWFDATGRLRGWENTLTGETRPAEFTKRAADMSLSFNGVHIISQRTIMALVDDWHRQGEGPMAITPFYISRSTDLDIRCFEPTKPYMWHDIGSPEKLQRAREDFNAR